MLVPSFEVEDSSSHSATTPIISTKTVMSVQTVAGTQSASSQKTLPIILGVLIPLVAILGCIIVYLACCRRRRKLPEEVGVGIEVGDGRE
jgi:hypothetical protein